MNSTDFNQIKKFKYNINLLDDNFSLNKKRSKSTDKKGYIKV